MCIVKKTGQPKVIYKNETEAWIAVRYGHHFDMEPYECPQKLGWHIGHPSNYIPPQQKPKPKKPLSRKKSRWAKYARKDN
jgi:hypothetical protein